MAFFAARYRAGDGPENRPSLDAIMVQKEDPLIPTGWAAIFGGPWEYRNQFTTNPGGPHFRT